MRTFRDRSIEAPTWKYRRVNGESRAVAGDWTVKFVEGGPELPADFEMRELASWTTLGDAEAQRFAGTARYTIEFSLPEDSPDDWLLDLGKVCDSARVRVNGQLAVSLWCAPFRTRVGQWLKTGKNTLEVEVTNVAANRIRDLDRRKVNWKYFYNANLASLTQRRRLDASVWPLRDSGLLGPVTLTPLKNLKP